MIADKLQGYVTVFTYKKDDAYLKHEANIPLLCFMHVLYMVSFYLLLSTNLKIHCSFLYSFLLQWNLK